MEFPDKHGVFEQDFSETVVLVLLADREQLDRQVFAVVHSSVHGDETLQARLVFDVGIVETRVEHDDGERQDVACVCNTHTHTHTHALVFLSCASLHLIQW